ncbi:MAG: alanine racemase, partial [Gammaproteobacteria bacterium]|nr:alanine racemase [Gammaproteobacteria bacterium]
MRPARAVLNPDALRHNFSRVRQAAPASRVMAIVKANGYGHGLVWAARTLREADAFGVASVEDAVALRDAGIKQPIVLLEGFFHTNELPALLRYNLDSVVHHEKQIAALEQMKQAGSINFWVKVDTGMHRIGIPPETVAPVIQRLKSCASAGAIRLLSHFPNADNPFDTHAPDQIQQLGAFDRNLEKSLANSAGIIHWPASHMDWVRPGIMLYGA